MKKILFVFVVVMSLFACKQKECIDCVDRGGNVFKFCDPPEPTQVMNTDSLVCGDVYTE